MAGSVNKRKRMPLHSGAALVSLAVSCLVALLLPATGSAEAPQLQRTQVLTTAAGEYLDSITVIADPNDVYANGNQFRVRVSVVQRRKRYDYVPVGFGLVDQIGERIDMTEVERQLSDLIKRSVANPESTLGPEGAAAAQALTLLWLVPLTTFAIVLATPGSERRIEGERALIIEELSPTPPGLRIQQPCRPVRFAPGTAGDWRGVPRAAACPLPPYQSVIPPRLSIFSGGGRDSVDLSLLPASPRATSSQWVDGGNWTDIITGSPSADVLVGNNGDDGVYGKEGNDEIWGNKLRTLFQPAADSGAGDDINRDNDVLWGGDGSDAIIGSWGDDLIDGGDGNDNLRPWTDYGFADGWPDRRDPVTREVIPDNVALQGGPGEDIVIGGRGVDTMSGGHDRDTLLAKESDFGDPDAVDNVVDCHGVSFETAPRNEFYRRSVGDRVRDCGLELNRPVTANDARDRIPGNRFPWIAWPTTPGP